MAETIGQRLRQMLAFGAGERAGEPVFSVSYNALAVGLAVMGHVNPLVAAILMPASSLASLTTVGTG